jgi:hypothetical protein
MLYHLIENHSIPFTFLLFNIRVNMFATAGGETQVQLVPNHHHHHHHLARLGRSPLNHQSRSAI